MSKHCVLILSIICSTNISNFPKMLWLHQVYRDRERVFFGKQKARFHDYQNNLKIKYWNIMALIEKGKAEKSVYVKLLIWSILIMWS